MHIKMKMTLKKYNLYSYAKKVRKVLNKLAVLTNGHTDGQKNWSEVKNNYLTIYLYMNHQSHVCIVHT